jgi:hypothetical protein
MARANGTAHAGGRTRSRRVEHGAQLAGLVLLAERLLQQRRVGIRSAFMDDRIAGLARHVQHLQRRAAMFQIFSLDDTPSRQGCNVHQLTVARTGPVVTGRPICPRNILLFRDGVVPMFSILNRLPDE